MKVYDKMKHLGSGSVGDVCISSNRSRRQEKGSAKFYATTKFALSKIWCLWNEIWKGKKILPNGWLEICYKLQGGDVGRFGYLKVGLFHLYSGRVGGIAHSGRVWLAARGWENRPGATESLQQGLKVLKVTMMRRQQVRKARMEPTMIRAGVVLDGEAAPLVGLEDMAGAHWGGLIIQWEKRSKVVVLRVMVWAAEPRVMSSSWWISLSRRTSLTSRGFRACRCVLVEPRRYWV